jgi:hypothetical protein
VTRFRPSLRRPSQPRDSDSCPTASHEIQDELNGTGTGFSEGLCHFPTSVISLPLLRINLSSHPGLGYSLIRQNIITSSVFKLRASILNPHLSTIRCWSQNSSVGIATRWTARVRFPTVQDFSLLHSAQTGSGAHPASCTMGTDCSFPGG